MNLYECRFIEQDWVCYVFAETRGKAKCLFNKEWGNGAEDFIWVRCRLIGRNAPIETPNIVDSERHKDYPVVLALGGGFDPEENEE
jgi:hypothetical protein